MAFIIFSQMSCSRAILSMCLLKGQKEREISSCFSLRFRAREECPLYDFSFPPLPFQRMNGGWDDKEKTHNAHSFHTHIVARFFFLLNEIVQEHKDIMCGIGRNR